MTRAEYARRALLRSIEADGVKLRRGQVEVACNIWIRKVEAGEVEIKAATLDEIEFENGGEAELFFVAIRPGTYEYGSKGMMERGVVGQIIVESGGEAAAAESPKQGD